ncbi:hypothetical protein ACVIJ6_005321 [Bradyrhizobium sp. USDA 4369]
MSAFATAIVAFTSCFVARDGATVRTRRGGFIASWACSCATRRRNAGSRASCGIAARRRDRTRPGQWISSMTSWLWDASFGGSRLSTSSPASRRRWHRGSPSAAPMSWRYWKESAMKWESRRRSASIKPPSSYRAISTSEPISAASRWTSPGQASRRDNAFMEAFNGRIPGGMPQRPLVPDACRRRVKSVADHAPGLPVAQKIPDYTRRYRAFGDDGRWLVKRGEGGPGAPRPMKMGTIASP